MYLGADSHDEYVVKYSVEPKKESTYSPPKPYKVKRIPIQETNDFKFKLNEKLREKEWQERWGKPTRTLEEIKQSIEESLWFLYGGYPNWKHGFRSRYIWSDELEAQLKWDNSYVWYVDGKLYVHEYDQRPKEYAE